MLSDAVAEGCAVIEQPNWAAREMAHVNLGDPRLNRRAASLLATLGAEPTVSIPAACQA
ncbi:MAG: transposase DNA-binding-containing protein [Gammaproteobacteria bacterium]